MDTKSKKFSRSRAVKVLLVVLYIVCFGAAGIIAGFSPAFRYTDNGMSNVLNIMFCDSFENTNIYTGTMRSFEESFFHSAVEGQDFSGLLSREDFFISISTNGETYQNGVEAVEPYTITIRDGKTEGFRFIGYRVTDVKENFTFTVGMAKTTYDELESLWAAIRRNLWIIAVSDLCLLAVGIVLMCLLCGVSGEEPDGAVSLSKSFGAFYEFPIAAIIALFVPFVTLVLFGFYPLQQLANQGSAGKVLYMVLSGVITAVYALIWLYLAVSIAERVKTKCAWKGSLILRILYYIGKGLGWCGSKLMIFFRFIKELATGELFKGTASRRLIFMDAGFVAYSCLMLIIALACRGILGAAIFLEFVGLGFFLYGRYLLHRDIAVMERQIKEMYSGNYTYEEKLSKNSPYAESVEKLRTLAAQYQKGLEESVKAERMKIELVTNVSHDLKTPLTSIISYVDLLSKEELTPAAQDYVKVLQQKSERLKNIVSDVFELAKTTSGEIDVAREQLDLSRLSWQTLGEMEDRIQKSGFTLKTKICEPPVTIVSDGKRVYRIIQNLMDNALKYSLAGTRIYFTLEKTERRAIITIKNIAAYEMDFTTDEILERFSRGDKSRTTEGSGLGLSIAQGFTLACGGEFGIEIDGDMFKATISFPLLPELPAAPSEQPKAETVTADE